MLNPKEALIVANFFYQLDTAVRKDLAAGKIADERDYVSRMITHFEYPLGVLSSIRFEDVLIETKWFSRVAKPSEERKFGCDGMMVFQVDGQVKVGLFEAKWPRVIKKPDYKWDSPQKKSKTSRFTSQIIRQAKWVRQAFIWEMFFYEAKVGTLNAPFDKNGSSCVPHFFAEKMVKEQDDLKVLWNNSDLLKLIKSAQSPTYDGSNEANLREIIFNILVCNYGTLIRLNPTQTRFYLSANDDERVSCPIVSFTGTGEINEQVQGFMAECGLEDLSYSKISLLPPLPKKKTQD